MGSGPQQNTTLLGMMAPHELVAEQRRDLAAETLPAVIGRRRSGCE